MDELLTRLAEVSDLERTAMLLAWDQEVCMPPAGAAEHGELRATVGRLAHERFVDGRVGALLEEAQPRGEVERDIVVVARRDFDKARRVPAELVAEMARAAAAGHRAWLKAREANDFSLFAPALEHNVELRRTLSACFGEAEHPYDPLLDDYEPGMRTAAARAAIERLRDGLVPLVAAARHVDHSLLHGALPEAAQRALAQTVLDAVGVDDDAWRLDEAAHPFSAAITVGDIRLTTRYHDGDLESLFSSLHEFGHGLYEHQVDPALARTPLGSGASSAWHESQSRLWENMVGRSAGFWRWCFPHAQAAFPERFGDRTWQEVQRAVNAVRPTLIRVSADEVTYGLHIVLRFELELALIEGELEVADLPAAWNERTRTYLGLDVPDDVHGVLQDVHWSEGLFGYFPTYALGNVIAGQLWARIADDLPDLEERFAEGDFAPLRAWLAEHVHRHGRRLLPEDLLERVVGGPLDPGPYLGYLEGKLQASAQLMS
ncbi:MAG TPA: carboxypeptidase M32 [Solirubrobacteraceae bacterium]